MSIVSCGGQSIHLSRMWLKDTTIVNKRLDTMYQHAQKAERHAFLHAWYSGLTEYPVLSHSLPLAQMTWVNSTQKWISRHHSIIQLPILLISLPTGCLGTAGALMYGLRAFRLGKTRHSQLSMRARIFAQGFTVVAIIVGVVNSALKPKQWAEEAVVLWCFPKSGPLD